MKQFLIKATTNEGKDLPIRSDGERFSIEAELLKQYSGITVSFPSFSADRNTDGYYLIGASNSHQGTPLIRFRDGVDGELLVKRPLLSLFAVKLPGRFTLVRIPRNFRYELTASAKDGQYSISLFCNLSAQPVVDPLELIVTELPEDTDFGKLAGYLRNCKIKEDGMRPMRETCLERPELEYSRTSPLIRIRMGWKPVPPPILHQTLENEPEMKVVCDFRRVRDIADELHRQGVEKAELSLVGWNQKGHDGRWPQIFPVEESLGGEEELKKTIAHVQALGYEITPHVNVLDHYEIAENFDPNDLARASDGEPIRAGSWGGGACYHACPHAQWKHTDRDFERVAKLGFRGLLYSDVLSIIPPEICNDPAHPCGERESVEIMRRIIYRFTELFGGFSSEGCMDFAIPGLDYSLYNAFPAYHAKPKQPIVSEYVPLWELIYHGFLLYNPSATTVNYSLKDPDAAVTVALYGGRPTFYYYSKFVTQESKNWMGTTDLTCDTDEELRSGVAKIRSAVDEYTRTMDLQLVPFSSYRVLESGLRIMDYENGVSVAGNYTDQPISYRGEEIPAHGYRYFRD